MKVIGIEKINYTSKKTNKLVDGYNIYVTDELKAPGCEGCRAEHAYVKSDIVSRVGIMIGDNIEFMYNKFGSVTDVRVI